MKFHASDIPHLASTQGGEFSHSLQFIHRFVTALYQVRDGGRSSGALQNNNKKDDGLKGKHFLYLAGAILVAIITTSAAFAGVQSQATTADFSALHSYRSAVTTFRRNSPALPNSTSQAYR
jgi:hypothetical protein